MPERDDQPHHPEDFSASDMSQASPDAARDLRSEEAGESFEPDTFPSADSPGITGSAAGSASFHDSDAPAEDDVATLSLEEFESLTLAEAVTLLARQPVATFQALWQVLRPRDWPAVPAEPVTYVTTPLRVRLADADLSHDPATRPEADEVAADGPRTFWQRLIGWLGQPLIFIPVAFVVMLFATVVMGTSDGPRSETIELVRATPYVLIAWLVLIGGEILSNRARIRQWWQGLDGLGRGEVFIRAVLLTLILTGIAILIDASDEQYESVLGYVSRAVPFVLMGGLGWLGLDATRYVVIRYAVRRPDVFRAEVTEQLLARVPETPAVNGALPWYMRIHPIRVFMAGGAAFLSALVWMGSTGNTFSTTGFYIWLTSIALWAFVFAPFGFNPVAWLARTSQQVRQFRIQPHIWTILAMLIIMGVGAGFRLSYLNGDPAAGTAIPAEMTSDHVEKILDSNRVLLGARNIFFANNGGREPIQMYLMAMMAQLPGQGMNFETLKLLSVLEGVLSLPFLYWMGREMVGERNRRLAVLTGLALAALVAMSYWHLMLSRLALRIILTPMVVALVMVYITRAIRTDDRSAYIKAGLALGFGLYTYQAVRMVPVLIIVAGLACLYIGVQHWRQRGKRLVNLAVLVWIAFVVFLPLFHYSLEQPDQFWRRTAGRLLGDDIIQEVLDDGRIVERQASVTERIEAFNQNIPILLNNVRNSLLMFNWKGDVAWINGYPNHPVLDPASGALLLVGLVVWVSYAIRRRDIAMGLVPVMLFIMLLPSALSIAFPVENPSHTRTSGALPFAYLLAAFPLALVVEQLSRRFTYPRGWVLGVGIAVVLLGASYFSNADVYFSRFRFSYETSSLPYSAGGAVMRSFALGDGGFGNAFMLGYPFWWDHRALGIESGRADWPNGIVSRDDIPTFLREAYQRADRYRLHPERDLMFFYAFADEDTGRLLAEWFPQGREVIHQTYQRGDDFKTYQVPALGTEGFISFLSANLPE